VHAGQLPVGDEREVVEQLLLQQQELLVGAVPLGVLDEVHGDEAARITCDLVDGARIEDSVDERS
jgi:hypothetical protein